MMSDKQNYTIHREEGGGFRRQTIFLLFLCVFAFFVGNGQLPFKTDIMEARNIVTAREMIHDNNWMIPTMNGELRLEKPPLPTWIAALIEAVSPENLPAQRAAAGVMAVIFTLFLYLTARYMTWRKDYALLAAIVFVTCQTVVFMSRFAAWDIYCHAFMMGGIYFLLRLFFDERYYGRSRKWTWASLAGLMMGLAFLSKGPIPFYAMLLPFLIAQMWVERPKMKGKWVALAFSVILCLAISSFWYLWLYEFHPETLQAVMNKEADAWTERHVHPWHFYTMFVLQTSGWCLFVVAAFAVSYCKRYVAVPKAYKIAFIWMVTTLVLLSCFPEKKTRYLLPMMAPCALTIAHVVLYFFDNHSWTKPANWLYKTHTWILMLAYAVLPVFFHTKLYQRDYISLPLTITFDGIAVAAAVWLFFLYRKKNVGKVIALTAFLSLLVGLYMISSLRESKKGDPVNTIYGVNQVKELQGMQLYYNTGDSIAIQLVYIANQKILPVDLCDSADVAAKLPFALVSSRSAAEQIPSELLTSIDTVKVDVYDDNRVAPTHRAFRDEFRKQVTILKRK